MREFFYVVLFSSLIFHLVFFTYNINKTVHVFFIMYPLVFIFVLCEISTIFVFVFVFVLISYFILYYLQYHYHRDYFDFVVIPLFFMYVFFNISKGSARLKVSLRNYWLRSIRSMISRYVRILIHIKRLIFI